MFARFKVIARTVAEAERPQGVMPYAAPQKDRCFRQSLTRTLQGVRG